MKLVITIDTEEDNWGRYQEKNVTVDNISRIPQLQQLFDEFDITPTYLITYPVATNPASVAILKSILQRNGCEIGTHCHAWNTPPLEEELNEKNSMLSNLPYELQLKKIACLHETIAKVFKIQPVVFRAGRWGYNNDTAEALMTLGYTTDTSVTAFTDWSEYLGPDYSRESVEPYYYKSRKDNRGKQERRILEIPATVGFAQKKFVMCNSIMNVVKRKPFSYFKLASIFQRTGLINKIMLSPETHDGPSMVNLCKSMMKNRFSFMNLFFHSTSLLAGLSPFVVTKNDEQIFLQRIREVLVFCRREGIGSIALSDVRNAFTSAHTDNELLGMK